MPFGEDYQITSTHENDKMFVGKEKDKETGLYYFGARYMEAVIGRFISPDPVGAVDPRMSGLNGKIIKNPQRINTYAYGLNNPYRYIDPDGNQTNQVYEYFDTRGILDHAIRSANDPFSLLPSLPPIPHQGMDSDNNFKRVRDAYEIAKEGGRNAGLLRNYMGRSTEKYKKLSAVTKSR